MKKKSLDFLNGDNKYHICCSGRVSLFEDIETIMKIYNENYDTLYVDLEGGGNYVAVYLNKRLTYHRLSLLTGFPKPLYDTKIVVTKLEQLLRNIKYPNAIFSGEYDINILYRTFF